jgi:hypothetical protein
MIHELVYEEDGLEAEPAVAEIEQILEGRVKEVKDHGVVIALGAEPSDKWHTDTENYIDSEIKVT